MRSFLLRSPAACFFYFRLSASAQLRSFLYPLNSIVLRSFSKNTLLFKNKSDENTPEFDLYPKEDASTSRRRREHYSPDDRPASGDSESPDNHTGHERAENPDASGYSDNPDAYKSSIHLALRM